MTPRPILADDDDFAVMPDEMMRAILKTFLRTTPGRPKKDDRRPTVHMIAAAAGVKKRAMYAFLMGKTTDPMTGPGRRRLSRVLRKIERGMIIRDDGRAVDIAPPENARPTIVRSISFLMSGRPVVRATFVNSPTMRLPGSFPAALSDNGPKSTKG